jgi:hypothetical protein
MIADADRRVATLYGLIYLKAFATQCASSLLARVAANE